MAHKTCAAFSTPGAVAPRSRFTKHTGFRACLARVKLQGKGHSNPQPCSQRASPGQHLQQLRHTGAPALGAALAAGLLAAAPAHAGIEVAANTLSTSFGSGFTQALLLIFFSELGDKTFFIALLLALQRPKPDVFVGTFGALAVMTVISVLLGQALHELDEVGALAGSRVPWDDVLAVVLLTVFGVQTLRSAKDAEAIAAEERGEAEAEARRPPAPARALARMRFALLARGCTSTQ
jgi:Uncharacterized protein family UPF0016